MTLNQIVTNKNEAARSKGLRKHKIAETKV